MNNENNILNQTTVFAAVSSYIYFIWFQFENGICTQYKIPTYYITPSITGLLIAAATILSILLASFKLLGVATPIFKRMQNPQTAHLHGIYFVNGLMLIIGILLFHAFPFSWKGILYFAVIAILTNLLGWGMFFLFKIRQKKTFEQKISESISEAQNENFDILTVFNLKLNRNQWMIVIMIALLPGVTYMLGMGTAAGQKTYQCLIGKENLVILKKYDDLLICRKFQLKSRNLQDTLYIVKMSNDTIYKFTEIEGLLTMP